MLSESHPQLLAGIIRISEIDFRDTPSGYLILSQTKSQGAVMIIGIASVYDPQIPTDSHGLELNLS